MNDWETLRIDFNKKLIIKDDNTTINFVRSGDILGTPIFMFDDSDDLYLVEKIDNATFKRISINFLFEEKNNNDKTLEDFINELEEEV